MSNADSERFSVILAFDIRTITQLDSWLSIMRTIFICVAVGLGSAVFSHDANTLLLNPIQRMMEKMQTIKDNPLEAMKLGDREFRREQLEIARRKETMSK